MSAPADPAGGAPGQSPAQATARPASGAAREPLELPAGWRPARFWRRYAAWSLDAAAVAALTSFIGAPKWSGRLDAIGQAHAAMNARMAELMSASVLGDAGFGGFLAQAVVDPALNAASLAMVGALLSLVLGWLCVYALFGAAWELGFLYSPWGAPPGKAALGLRIVDRRGRPPGLGRAAARYLAGAVSWAILNLGHLLAAAAPEYTALHDRMAGARVIERGAAPLPAWAWAWIGLQVLSSLAATWWLARAMQAAMDAALGGL